LSLFFSINSKLAKMKVPTAIIPFVAALAAIASARDPITLNLTGHIDPSQVMSFVYVPFEVESGVTSIYVLQNYSMKGHGNALDLGVFDQRGYQMMDAVNNTFGSRGWSGGFRNNFTITPSAATPGYNPGPISPGTWNVALGPYNSVPEGIDWQLNIVMGFDLVDEYFSPTFARVDFDTVDQFDQDEWLRGDFHMHTVYSDGKYTPNQQIENALSQNLSFIFFSDHNTDTSNNIIGTYQAALAPNLLICRAIEVTTRHGHWQAAGLEREQLIDWRYQLNDNPGFEAATEQVHRAGGFVSVNHPFAACPACNWGFDNWDHNDAIEVWNANWDPTDQQAVQKWHDLLVAGKFTTAIGGSDSHSPPSLNGIPTTVVNARGRKQAAIVTAVKNARAYIVEGPGFSLSFHLQMKGGVTAQIGDKVKVGSSDAQAVLSTEGMSGQKACFISEKGYLYNTTITNGRPILERLPAHLKFERVEVRNITNDSMLGLINPVWFLS
jgi:predicted metal-dependent phosphoesterase TrpH